MLLFFKIHRFMPYLNSYESCQLWD